MRSILSLTLLLLLLQPAPAPAWAEAESTQSAAPSAAAAAAPHTLKAVRLRPTADAFRLIFIFDRPAPYTLREELAGQRATLEFMNAALASLPAELSRVKDPRLTGVWLKQQDSGLVTLELRFPTAAIRLDHFAMDDPAAVVIDIFRTDGDAAIITSAPEETTLTPQAEAASPAPLPAETPAQLPHPTPALPPAEATPAADPALPPAVPALPPSALPRPALPPGMVTGSHGSALPSAAAPLPAVPAAHASAPVATAKVQIAAPHADEHPIQRTPGALRRGEAEPLDADYEFFPLSALRLTSPGPKAIRDAFLERRWATVVNSGLMYLQNNKMDQETAAVLYLMAEARWQLSRGRGDESLADMVNWFQQARSVDPSGDLGAFAAWRQAQAAMFIDDFDTALARATDAASSSAEAIRKQSMLMRIACLERMRRYPQALQLIAQAGAQTSSTAQRASLLVKEGTMRTGMGDYAGAWEAYKRATEIDPKWISLDMEGGKSFARTALETNHLTDARIAVEFIIDSFSSDEEKVRLLLLYAEILVRQGDLRTAEDIYYTMLRNIERTAKGAEVRKKMLSLYPNEMLDGQGRYCTLLAREGKVAEAMSELNKAYNTYLREGGPVDRLDPAMQVVVPLYMEYAMAHRNPYEVVKIWKYFGHSAAKNEPLRRRCLAPLADALEALDLNKEALQIVSELREDRPTSGTASPLDLAIQDARLRLKNGSPERAAQLLEDLQTMDGGPDRQAAIGELLVEAYQKANRPLEAAQALQALAEAPGVAPARRSEALLQAGEIFLERKMPAQTVELGLKCLLREKQELEKAQAQEGDPPDPVRANALRLLLARAYQASGDMARERVVLEDFLARPGITPEQKTRAEIMLSDNQRLSGQLDDVERLYQAVKGDAAADADWRKAADQMQRMLDWNRRHPDQPIDVQNTTATLAQ